MIERAPIGHTAKKHWADKPILRDFFWFLVLPHRLRQWMTPTLRQEEGIWLYEAQGCVGIGDTEDQAYNDWLDEWRDEMEARPL